MTSIEWLIEQLMERGFQENNFEILNQAKEMHKQEMKEMYLKGIENYDPTFKRKDDTFKVWECCGMEECICNGMDVEKLAETEYPIFDGDLLGIAHNQKHSRIDFINDYNKAKETLYTEEQVREAIRMGTEIKDGESMDNMFYTDDEIIQSLKQPKKD